MSAKMKRTQVYLEKDVDEGLQQLAARRGVSKAWLIRDCARKLLEEEGVAREPLMDIVGMAGGSPSNISEEHDRYLADQEIAGWQQ